ncbi:hypothetical protein [Pelagibacterium lentulum]|nr:hypothetical protein [Pelagibacterium lentulum]
MKRSSPHALGIFGVASARAGANPRRLSAVTTGVLWLASVTFRPPLGDPIGPEPA